MKCLSFGMKNLSFGGSASPLPPPLEFLNMYTLIR